MIKEKRISFEDLAMQIAIVASRRSEDLHKKVGACVLDKKGKVLGVGYNGIKSGHTMDLSFWKNRENRRNFIIHAEVNALSNINTQNAHLLAVTLLPCSSCANLIAASNIEKVLYIEEYEKDQESKNIFKFHKIELIKYES